MDELQRARDIVNHFRDEDAVARALSVALLGDEVEWAAHKKRARDFLDAMEKSFLAAHDHT